MLKKTRLASMICAAFIALPVTLPVFAAVDINTATQSELETVKGVGPAKAKAIIDYRTANGNYKTLEDLDKVKGFGKSSIEKLKPELTVSTGSAKK